MQLQRAPHEGTPSAGEVAQYVVAMAGELAVMARQAGLKALGHSLEETKRVARATLSDHQLENAAPDDAA